MSQFPRMFRTLTATSAACLAVIGLTGTTPAAEMDFENGDVADTYLHDGNPDTNYGGGNVLVMKNRYGVQHPMIRFDVSALSNVDVTDATLSMVRQYDGGDADNVLELYEITAAWNETEATWNDRTDNDAWTDAGGDIDASPFATVSIDENQQTLSIDLPESLVQSWIDNPSSNHGIQLRVSGPGTQQFNYHSSESDFSPTLSVEYVPEPGSLSLLSLGAAMLLRRRARTH